MSTIAQINKQPSFDL